jgi:hypothetical protein
LSYNSKKKKYRSEDRSDVLLVDHSVSKWDKCPSDHTTDLSNVGTGSVLLFLYQSRFYLKLIELISFPIEYYFVPIELISFPIEYYFVSIEYDGVPMDLPVPYNVRIERTGYRIILGGIGDIYYIYIAVFRLGQSLVKKVHRVFNRLFYPSLQFFFHFHSSRFNPQSSLIEALPNSILFPLSYWLPSLEKMTTTRHFCQFLKIITRTH